MATLVLSAAGRHFGGPIGSAVGAMIGQHIDAKLFAPKPRHGPRLGDLAVQTSSYGSQIPKIFGMMRVAGTVIWSMDLQEHKNSSGGAKGKPKTINYTYSASFAVAVSGRPVREVRRIWADGKLLRGAAGDFKSELGGFRLHGGGEDQAPDPLILAAEGAEGAPAYRGTAYVVFEDLALADFGNRIPSLTFELVAEEDASLLAIAEALSDGEVTADTSALPLVGYAASGDSVRSALEALGDTVPLRLLDDGGALRLASGVGEAALLPSGGEAHGSGSGGRMECERSAAAAVPAHVSVAFYDPERDFQTGLQRAASGEAGLRGERRVLAAAISAETAKALAERRLADAWAGRRQIKLHYSWNYVGLRPGLSVRVPGQPGRWRVVRWSLEKMVLTLSLVGVSPGESVAVPAAAGRLFEQPDLLHGETHLVLLDLPLSADGEIHSRPQIFAAAAGAEAGWRSAGLVASFDGGASWKSAGTTAAAAVMGKLVAPVPARGSSLIDLRSSLEVELLHDGMWLESRSDAALAAGANLAAVGNELLQFGVAEQVAPRRFRLSRLLRGRRGSEWAAQHPADESFVLIAAESLLPIDTPAAAMGRVARVTATGLGDGQEGVVAEAPVSGEALRPPSPVQLRTERTVAGDLVIRWVRRSRGGWTWLNGADTPLGEEREAYRVTVAGNFGAKTAEVVTPTFTYGAVEQAADGAAPPFVIEVAQFGSHAISRPARLVFE